MANACSLQGFVDFKTSLPLLEVAKWLSAAMFADIRFTDEETGEWDEVPCLHLERDFLGLRVVLGGDENEGYTLEVTTTLAAFVDIRGREGDLDPCDLSYMLMPMMKSMPDFIVLPPRY